MKIKAIFSTLLAGVLTLGLAVNVFAASGINAPEQSILDKLGQPVENAAGVTRYLPAGYINQARAYFDADGVNVTAEQAATIIDLIDKAQAILATTEVTAARDVPAATANQVIALAEQAAAVLGLTVTISYTPGDPNVAFTWQVTTADGTPVATSDPAVKATGIGFTATWAVAGLLVSALLGCAVYTAKTRRRAAAAAC